MIKETAFGERICGLNAARLLSFLVEAHSPRDAAVGQQQLAKEPSHAHKRLR